jgi:hypothetical protein
MSTILFQLLSDKAKVENKRPEQIYNWSYNVPHQLCSAVETIINQKGPKHGLSSYNTASGHGWNTLVRADHGLGAWRCHKKVCNHSPPHQRRFQNQSKHKKCHTQSDSGYRVFQLANITCKKDAPILLEKTVAKPLDDGWRKIKSSKLVVVWNQTDERSLVKLVPKMWDTTSLIEMDAITFLASEDGRESMIIDVASSESEIMLQVMQLTLLVVGDLAFFANALCKHGTCG